MAIVSDRLKKVAASIREGEPPLKLTVREFLSWFNAKRRGYWIVYEIRNALRSVGLETEPDFEAAYIDSTIVFAAATAKPEEPPVSPMEMVSTAGATVSGVATPVQADPTHRISKLAAANNKPVSVTPDAALAEAVTLMLTNDFSQLPVMTSERDVKGVVSWTSIGTRLSLGKPGGHARDVMDSHHEIRSDASLFQAIPTIVQHQYVLVRGADNRITGIVTASDLSLQFHQLAEPFLLLGEIENHVRRIIGGTYDIDELRSARDPSDSGRNIEGVADLTFGEYIRLLENPQRWEKLNMAIDRSTFCEHLGAIREIRNDVMHFDPDGIPPEDLDKLREFTRFLQRLQALKVP